MRNRNTTNGHAPQQVAHEPLMISSPDTVPGLQADVQRLQASAEADGNTAAEHHRIARTAAENAANARSNIEKLQQALAEEQSRLQQAETTHRNETTKAEACERAAQAALARADDLRRIISSLGAPTPTPAPTGQEPTRTVADVELVSSRSGEYPTAPANGPAAASPATGTQGQSR